MSWLNWVAPNYANTNNNQNYAKQPNEQKQQPQPFKPGDLCQLIDLKSMPDMNGKLCKIAGPFDSNEQRYPVLVLEINNIVAIKLCNLKLTDRKTIYIKDIILYPIKGCKGISLSSSIIDQKGLQYDRLYCLMSTKKKKIIAQSFKPKICWIQPSIPDENGIKISAPKMKNSIYIPRSYDPKSKVNIKYWNYKQGITGYDQGDVASEWLTKYFITHGYDRNDKVRLILFDPNFKRITHRNETSMSYLNNNRNKPSIVSFSNEFQFLVMSEESLNGLNNRIRNNRKMNGARYNQELDKIKMDRFRPNIVISSNGYYSPNFEDDIKLLGINGIKLYHTKNCPRCGMPSINQQTASRYHEPKNTLLTYRTGEKLGYLKQKNWKHKLFFGSYFIHDKCGQIKRGSVLSI
eukprot:197593_1